MSKITQLRPVPEYPPAPDHLAPETRLWWDTIVRDYQLEAHHLKLLQATAEAWDRFQQARAELARDGLTVKTGDGNIKAHPCVAIERDARTSFARLLRDLDLDVEPPSSGRVAPPPLRSNNRGR